MSELEAENKALKALCGELGRMLEGSYAERKRLHASLDDYKSMLGDCLSMYEGLNSMTDEALKKSDQLDKVMTNALENSRASYNKLAHVNEEKNSRFWKKSAEKRGNIRKITESFRGEYDRIVQMHVDAGEKRRIGEQRGRQHVADLVEAEVGTAPSDSLLYEIFPKEKIP